MTDSDNPRPDLPGLVDGFNGPAAQGEAPTVTGAANRIQKVFKKRPVTAYSKYVRNKLGLRGMSANGALRNLIDVAAAFDARGSQYSLTAGTLLGAVRDGDFIGHDTDTDISVPIEDFDPRILRDLCESGFRISKGFGSPDDGMELTLVRRMVETDLFFVYPRGEQTFFSAYADVREDGTAARIDYEFPRFQYTAMRFKGESFQAPTEPEVFLRCFYGDTWQTPVKGWNYAVDPPNASPGGRVEIAACRKSIGDYTLRETGRRLV